MALDIFLKIENLTGESADKAHRKEIDVIKGQPLVAIPFGWDIAANTKA